MLFIFLTGLALRLGMVLSPKSYWADEWFNIELALLPLRETFERSLHDVHPPLSFVLLHLSAHTFGMSEGSMRAVSFLSGIGMLFFGIKLCRRILPSPEAGWACLFLSLSAFSLQTANEVRGYSLHGFLAVLSIYASIRWVRDGRRGWALPAIAAMLLSVYTEHLAWLWIAGLWVWLFRRRLAASFLVLILSLPSAMLIVYQSVHRERSFDLERIGAFYHVPSLIKKAVGVIWHFAFGYLYAMIPGDPASLLREADGLFFLHAAGTLLVVVLMILGLKRAWSSSRDLFALGAATLLFPCIFLLAAYPIRFESRYLPFALPAFFALICYGLGSLRSGPARHGLILFIASLNLFASVYTIRLKTDIIHREDHRALVHHLSRETTVSDAIINHDLAITFYAKRLASPVAAHVYANHDAWVMERRSPERNVYVVGYRNMHPDVTHRILAELRERMAREGYEPVGEPVVFGGPTGLLFSYRFRLAGA